MFQAAKQSARTFHAGRFPPTPYTMRQRKVDRFPTSDDDLTLSTPDAYLDDPTLVPGRPRRNAHCILRSAIRLVCTRRLSCT